MSIVDRAKNILMSPVTEWEVIAKEPATPMGLMTGYAIPLAGIAAVVSIITSVIFGAALSGMIGGQAAGASVASGIFSGMVGFVFGMLLVFGMGYIVSMLAGSFGGVPDVTQGAKLIIYAGTPVWVANFVPVIGGLLALAGLAYACYLIAIGVRPVLGIPQEKTAGMTVVTLLIYFIGALVIAGINFVIGMIGAVAATGI
jgi:Yip1 domain